MHHGGLIVLLQLKRTKAQLFNGTNTIKIPFRFVQIECWGSWIKICFQVFWYRFLLRPGNNWIKPTPRLKNRYFQKLLDDRPLHARTEMYLDNMSKGNTHSAVQYCVEVC